MKNSFKLPRFAMTLFSLVIYASFGIAMEPRTEHTYKLAEGEAPPTATLDDVKWLAGAWKGSAFGSEFEEVWNPPSAGSMVGFFKLIKDGAVSFYEIMIITSDDGRLSLKVKHFSADFIAWEEKQDYVNFRLVGIEENAAHFSGISFYRQDKNRMTAYILMKTGDDIREEQLEYHRVE